jgi:hypothetical protein
VLLIEEYGEDIEEDLADRYGWALGDYFRGVRPWQELYRRMQRWGPDSWYQSKILMDEEIGRQRAAQPEPKTRAPLSPQGYSLQILLQLKVIDLLKELMRVIPASFSGKMPPPFPPEPRPVTAEQLIRDAMETANVHDVLRQMGVEP